MNYNPDLNEFEFEPYNPYSPWYGLNQAGIAQSVRDIQPNNARENPPGYLKKNDLQLTIMIKNGEKRIQELRDEIEYTQDRDQKYLLNNYINKYNNGISKLKNRKSILEGSNNIFTPDGLYRSAFNWKEENLIPDDDEDQPNKRSRPNGGKRTKRTRKSKRSRKSRKTKRSRKSKQSRKI